MGREVFRLLFGESEKCRDMQRKSVAETAPPSNHHPQYLRQAATKLPRLT
jgi:hypothetical protein